MTAVSGSATVGIDIGTTATKAVAVDDSGEVLARSRVAHKAFTPAADLLEHDAGRAWRRGPLAALAEVATAISGRELAGVCVAGMVPSLTAVGRRGNPLAPGLLYGDRRGSAEGSDDASSPTAHGMPDAEGFMRWMLRECPGARGYWPAQAVANYALGDVPAIDSALAMSLGALMSRGAWDAEFLEKLGVTESQLPVVVPMGEPAGTVSGTKAVMAGGTVDALCDQIVSGAENEGDVLVIFGATLIVWAVVVDWIDVPGLWTLPHTVAGKLLIGGPSNAGALFVDWARALIGTSTKHRDTDARDKTNPQAARCGDPRHVPVWTPYVRGERAPFNDPLLRSALHGLDISHDTESLERAAFEASGFVIRQMLDRAGISARRIVASGGGTRILPWMQAVADSTGLPVDVVAVHEGAALGAAYIARMAAGLAEGFDAAGSWAKVGARIEPDSLWQSCADERYEQFVALGPGG